MDEELRHIERVLRPSSARARPARRRLRTDAAHRSPRAPLARSRPEAHAPTAGRDAAVGESPVPASPLLWLALGLGTMGLVCGGVLIGWSLVGGRAELWSLGVPIAAGGQGAMLVGLVLQLERLWRQHRQTADRLKRVDHAVGDLRSTTALLGTTHSGPAAAFYAHMAGGANPQVLLTDLKGQLDMLAVRLGRHAES